MAEVKWVKLTTERYNNKSHYQAILDMVAEDRKI